MTQIICSCRFPARQSALRHVTWMRYKQRVIFVILLQVYLPQVKARSIAEIAFQITL